MLADELFKFRGLWRGGPREAVGATLAEHQLGFLRRSELGSSSMRSTVRSTGAGFARSVSCALGLLVTAGCGGAPREAPRTAAHEKKAPETVPAARCPATVDVSDLFARHAGAFGAAAAVDKILPRSLRMEAETGGKKGIAELVLDRAGHRSEEVMERVHGATGVDANGPWSVSVAGVALRLRPDEATSIGFEAWLLRRSYLAAFDANRDSATCTENGGARVRVSYRLTDRGAPELDFDLATAALLATSVTASDGRRSSTSYDTWSGPDEQGTRWPLTTSTVDAAGNQTKYRVLENVAGPGCNGVAAGISSTTDCLALPKPALAFEWPASGIVKTPMRYYLGELSIRVGVQGREVWALLDSGASITIVDATTPAGAAFVSNMELAGSGSSQKIRAGLGELSSLRIGKDLVLRHLPTASIPIPALDAFGDRRPEVIVGFSLFLGAAVRVDYAKNELTFARPSDALFSRAPSLCRSVFSRESPLPT